MKLAQAGAIAVVGVKGHPVRIEAALLSGLPRFSIVGLPDAALSESKERVRAAFYAAGIHFPAERVTINLSPADIPKSGTGFDLPIAVAILAAIAGRKLDPSVFHIGELGLDGSVRRVRGILPAALGAKEAGASRLVVPAGARSEAELVELPVAEVHHLSQIAAELGLDAAPLPPIVSPEPARPAAALEPADLADVRGQDEARYALEIAAAGGHHLLMTGSPGVGKSMLASRMPSILPPLGRDEAVEVAAITSAAGDFDGALSFVPPFSAPHHSASAVSLVGGGSVPRPGAVSRAHRGVLFLDELPEFSSHTLQSLRQPMETGLVEIHRARMTLTFPARFQLVAAANPCACGNMLEEPGACVCSARQRLDYARKIGGPILDRIDVSVIMRRVKRSELSIEAEASAAVAARVREARERQRRRYAGRPYSRNADVPGRDLRAMAGLPDTISRMLDDAFLRGELTMRGADKAIRLAWTIADLSGLDAPDEACYHQALMYRVRGGQG